MNSLRSLKSLPPKLALPLVLAELGKLRKRRLDREAILQELNNQRHAEDPSSNAPLALSLPSAVLDPTHPISDLLLKKARYKVYWGGRGGLKSWGIAEALIRRAAAEPLRILCVREFQTSIKDSSHKILKDTIERLGYGSWFTVTAEGITSKAGAEFLFKGLHNNTNGIRSTEGIDICWPEEAHSISNASWRVLLPTVRKEGSEFWISFNMNDEDDATFKMFVGGHPLKEGDTLCPTVRPNSIVHKINYDRNPYLPSTLREEMETDKKLDYDLYLHIWEGMPLRISNEIIFSGKYEVREFAEDHWKKADRLFFGADFGFSQDPNTLIRFFMVTEEDDIRDKDGKVKARGTVTNLYIEHEAYSAGIDITDMDEFYQSVPGSKLWPIKSDSARPEFVSHFRGLGYNMSAAEKWEGSIKDGIAHLRGFNRIYIHPRCVNTAREARLYRYKVDKKQLDDKGRPLVLPIIVDAHNHAWDAIRYGLDGYIMRSGELGIWQRLGQNADQPIE